MTLVDDLLAGPRGRRLLLEFALASEKPTSPTQPESYPLNSAVFHASYHLDPGKERIAFFTRVGDEGPTTPLIRPYVGPEVVAEQLASLILAEATPELVRQALQKSVEWAMYWQPPEGIDVLAATDVVVEQLRRVADHLAAAPAATWWSQGLAPAAQWCVVWDEDSVGFRIPPMDRALQAWREEIQQRETRLAGTGQEYNNEWWSIPPSPIRVSTRELPDGTPAGLHGSEDTYGWDKGWAQRVTPPAGARVCEITGAHAWAQLCRRFPLEVTAQHWSQWRRTTGYDGGWVIPDYVQVAQHFDAVHLTVRGYLATAGRAVPVDEDHAAMLAGWNPDETFWLIDNVTIDHSAVAWTRDNTDTWQPELSSECSNPDLSRGL